MGVASKETPEPSVAAPGYRDRTGGDPVTTADLAKLAPEDLMRPD